MHGVGRTSRGEAELEVVDQALDVLEQEGEEPSRARGVAELSEAEEAALTGGRGRGEEKGEGGQEARGDEEVHLSLLLAQLAAASPLAQLMFATKVIHRTSSLIRDSPPP